MQRETAQPRNRDLRKADFVGPDGRHYDANALPAHIRKVHGESLIFRLRERDLFRFDGLKSGMLPHSISDWKPAAASS